MARPRSARVFSRLLFRKFLRAWSAGCGRHWYDLSGPEVNVELEPGLTECARPTERSVGGGRCEPATPCRRTVVSRPELDRWHHACSQRGETCPQKVVNISLLGESRSPWVPELAFEQPSPKLSRRL